MTALVAASPALFASTQRTIGWIIAVLLIAAMLLYWFFNWFQNKEEIGAELELAPNRKPQWDDDLMETKRLDMSLTAGLATLAIVAITLPLYWLAEPGRQEGAIEFTEGRYVVAGEGLYAENCAQCHGSVDGPGGVRSFAIVDDNGNFVEQVDWKVPSLGALMYRFSEEEVRYILNFGRQNSPMPAWGAPGGGPLTAQQIDHVIQYVAREQLPATEVAEEVESGLHDAAIQKALREDDDLRVAYYQALDAVEHPEGDEPTSLAVNQLSALDARLNVRASAIVELAQSDDVVHGELLFTNPASAGSYGCARCHSAGWSYDAHVSAAKAEAAGNVSLLDPVVHGGGGFGPNLTNGATLRQFDSVAEMSGFIVAGSQDGLKYGNFGQGDGGGQMPAFGTCVGDRDTAERRPLEGLCDEAHISGLGMLSVDQIEAIVTYERSLGIEPPAPAPEPVAVAPAPTPEPTPEPTREPAPEPVVELGTVDATATFGGDDPATITLTGDVLNEGQRLLLVTNAANAVGDQNVIDQLNVLGLDEEIEGADGRVGAMAQLLPTINENLLQGRATLVSESLTVEGLAPSFEAKDVVDAAAAASGVPSPASNVTVDAGTFIGSLDLSGVQFQTGTATLTADATIILDDAAETLAAFPDAQVEVQGHTDDIGSDASNLALSQDRADSVLAYLVSSGVDAERLTAVGYGETIPVADNETPEGRQINRRVVFEVQS